MNGSVKVIEEITISLKYLCLIIRLRKLIVNVKELYRLGIKITAQPADTVPVHLLIGNTLLDRLRGVRFQPGKRPPFLGGLPCEADLRPAFFASARVFLACFTFLCRRLSCASCCWFLAICDTSFLAIDL